jgi:translation initiation factor eIF-2B subunit beta
LLKRRQIRGSEPCAIATAHILLQVVAKSKWQDVDSLLQIVSSAGRRLVRAQPRELVIANIVRRVLGLIRDEAAEDRNDPSSDTASDTQTTPTDSISHQWPPTTVAKQDSAGDYLSNSARPPLRPGNLTTYSSISVPKSLFHILSASPPTNEDGFGQGSPFGTSGASTPSVKPRSAQIHALRSEVIDGIEEIKDEISQADEQIAALSEVQINPGDYVLIHQPSPTVERFMLRAAQKRKFTVLLATEPVRDPTTPTAVQHVSFRKKLSAAGITVVNIMNGGLMAYMSRVDKVVLGARAIIANGGVITDAGAAAIARAAKEQGNAVIVLSGVYKLSTELPSDESSVIEWSNPSNFVDFANGAMVSGVKVRSAVTELIPPEFIDTYITNLGTHSRDHLSSLLLDHYKQEDVDFPFESTVRG